MSKQRFEKMIGETVTISTDDYTYVNPNGHLKTGREPWYHERFYLPEGLKVTILESIFKNSNYPRDEDQLRNPIFRTQENDLEYVRVKINDIKEYLQMVPKLNNFQDLSPTCMKVTCETFWIPGKKLRKK